MEELTVGFYRLPAFDESRVGHSFGEWTQIGPSFKVRIDDWRRHRVAVCQCSCGRIKIVHTGNLYSGKNTRCYSCSRSRNNTKHGLSRSPEYSCWTAMIARCTSDIHIGYKYYGGRGIAVCDRWLNSFEAFLEDMGPRPSLDHQLDRFPDRDGNYEPGNVRWATPLENVANRDYTTKVKYGGDELTVRQLAERVGLRYVTLRNRLSRGWSLDEAIATPAGQKRLKTTA